MKEFIELTRVFVIKDEEDEESMVFVSVGHIDFFERIEEDSLTEVHTHNYSFYVRETPKEILKLIDELE